MKRVVVFCCCLLWLFPAYAGLTLEECRRLAREHYPEIRQYDLIRQTAEFTVSNAWRAYLPQFTLSAQATWQSDVADFPGALKQMLVQQGVDLPGLKKGQYKAAVDLNQTFWDGGKSRADRRIAEADEAEARQTVDVDLYAVDARIDELFFGILLLNEQIAQIELTLELLRSNLDKVQALQRNGMAMQSDADAVEVELLSMRQQLGQVEAAHRSYRRMLSVFTGKELEGEELVRPEAVVISPSAEPARPELALFDARVGKLAAQEQLVKASVRPQFGAFAQGYYGYPGLNFIADMMDGAGSWNAQVGVRMQWYFGGYYTKRNSLQKIRTAQQQVDVQRDVFLFNTRLQSTQEEGEIARLRKALADDDRIVELRRSVRQAAESRLNNGVIDTDDLLRKITEENVAATARSAREIELLKAIYELKHTINQ